jgi:hypothetical protein
MRFLKSKLLWIALGIGLAVMFPVLFIKGNELLKPNGGGDA